MVINVTAVLYGVAMLVHLVWPRAEYYGDAWHQQYAVVVFVPLAITFGVVPFAIRTKLTHRLNTTLSG